MRIGLIIVDLDMTLVDTARRCYDVLVKLSNVNGVSFSEFMEMYYDERGIRSGLALIIGPNALDYWFWRRCWLRYINDGEYGELMPGALEALRILKGEGRLIVMATGREIESNLLTPELAVYGLLNLLDGYMALGDLGPNYNKGDLLKRILGIYNNGSVKGAVYVTDHPRDIEVCRGMGLLSIGVLNKWVKELNADKVIRNLMDLPKAVKELEEAS
ncbi:HAD family hydrolase [Caldivirga maquilingensis]|uniref:HAD family hydrolase n=1 Tax=Caldivirga maquilingensis TaxID=76887 RepID=UPI00064F3D8B|nr:HAD family hydrolase [Caldivirga maquilingensis]